MTKNNKLYLIASTLTFSIILFSLTIIVMIKKMIIPQIKNNDKKDKHKMSFTFAWILSFFDININNDSSILIQYSYTTFILNLIALLCFINVIGYLITYLLINNNDYETKYPRFKRLIIYFKKKSYIFLAMEIILCLLCLITIIVFSFIILKQNT
nr:hypothetical protein [Lentinula edodes]UZS77798.1 hypothetical protein [Lentinula edodes]UZS77848.1 hypothetical protein [Lentinula edodes]UZS77898.1 hypothetical protein [Lentinula edodes]UZS77948.1 hypothetical protein [Lentinula edodes]